MSTVARNTFRILGAALALVVVAVLLGFVPINAGFLKGTIADAVNEATGFDLSIQGPLRVRLGLTPGLSTGELSLAGPQGDPLLEVDSLQASISLLALVRGRVHVREVVSNGIRVDYCSELPDFPDETAEESEPPPVGIDEIRLTGISIRCGSERDADLPVIDIHEVSASAAIDSPVQLGAGGNTYGLDFELSLTAGELNDLLAGAEQFPLSATLASGASSLQVSGHLRLSSGGPIAEARFELEVPEVKPLAESLGLELPDLGALTARGDLHIARESLELSEFVGELGNSHFAGDSLIDFAGDRVRVAVNAISDRLDVAPFLVDESEETKAGTIANDGDVELRAALDALDAFDADVMINVRDVTGLPLSLGSVEASAQVTNGSAELRSLTANILGGRVSITGDLRRGEECVRLELDGRASELDLATLNPTLSLERPIGGGVATATVESTSCGDSLFAHRDSLRADAGVGGVHLSIGGESLPLRVDELTLSVSPGERGRGRLRGSLLGEKVDAGISVGSLEALLVADTWPLDVDVRGGGARLLVGGRARLAAEQMLVDARLRLDAPAFGTLHAWTDGAADAHLPLSVETRLRADESEIVADEISISLGSSDVSGRVSWDYTQDPDLLAVTIRSKSVDFSELVTLLPSASGESDSASREDPDDETPRAGFLPPVDLDIEIGAIHADRLDIQDLSVSGRLRRGLIDGARVNLTVEDEVQLDGKLDLDARQLPARGRLEFTAENLDIGRVLRRMQVVDDLQLRADALDLLVTMQGATPRQFALSTLLQADLAGFNWRIPRSGSADDAAAEEDLEVDLEQVQLTTAPGQATTWVSHGRVDGLGAELFMRAPSLNDVFSDMPELPITLVAAAGNDVAMIDARFDRTTDDRLLARVIISGQVIASENRNLSDLASPLEDYQLQSSVIMGENRLQLAEVQMLLGTSSMQGRFDIDAGGPRTKFDVSLHAPYLQTDDLLYWSRDFREAMPDHRNPVEPVAGNEEIDAGDEPGERQGVLFLFNDFLAEFRETNDLAVHLTVDELHAGSDLLGGAEIQLYVDETEFKLSPVTFSLPGGGVDAEYRASVRDGRLDAGLNVHADALSYGGLLRLADPESEARGLLYLDADISADVDLPPGSIPLNLLFENAQGEISLAAWPENFEAGILDLWSANLVLAILPTPDTGESSRLNCLVTRFDIDDGLMTSRTTLLDTTATIIRGRGTIDLHGEQLDLLVWPQAKREKFLSVSTPVTITGTFDDFRIGVEPAGFIGTVIKWYTALIYVPFKWLTGERFPADGTATCFDAMDWELTPELREYFLQRDFSAPPTVE